jgi:hypothetical protein
LASHLSPELQEQALSEALGVVLEADISRAIDDRDILCKVKVALQSHLPKIPHKATQLPLYLDWEEIQGHLSFCRKYAEVISSILDKSTLRYNLQNLGKHLILLQCLEDKQEDVSVDLVYSVFTLLDRLFTEIESYAGWVTNLHSLSNSQRTGMLWMIGVLAPRIVELGGEKAILETQQAIQDVTEWWP